MKLLSILPFFLLFIACSSGEETVYEKFAEQYLNDPSKYEFVSADTVDLYGLFSIEYELGAQYSNFETSIQRALDLLEMNIFMGNPYQYLRLADSITSLNADELFPEKSQHSLELNAQFEGIQNRIKIEQSKFESMFATFQKRNGDGVIYVDHKYRTSSNKGILIIAQSLLIIDTTANELIFAKVIK